jgi:hypothetical protein
MQRLNARFARGRASNDLSEVGLLIHQFDSYDDGNHHRFAPWDRCTSPWACYQASDRVSVMSVSASSTREPDGNWPLYSSSLAGIIFNPQHNALLCSYPYDAGTSERRCDPIGRHGACSPGCTYGDWAQWCDEERGWPCAWPPDHLAESIAVRDRIAAARGQTWERDAPWDFVKEGGFYNELVFEFDAFHAALPDSIDAIFFIRDDCFQPRMQPWIPGQQEFKCEEYARWAHAELQARWPDRARHIPLVALDVFNWEAPLSMAEDGVMT